MENEEEEFRKRLALLREALGELPPDMTTLSALFDVAVSAAISVTFDPSAARLIFEARMKEYECHWRPASRSFRQRH